MDFVVLFHTKFTVISYKIHSPCCLILNSPTMVERILWISSYFSKSSRSVWLFFVTIISNFQLLSFLLVTISSNLLVFLVVDFVVLFEVIAFCLAVFRDYYQVLLLGTIIRYYYQVLLLGTIIRYYSKRQHSVLLRLL